VVLDRDGSGTVTSADTIYAGARVALFVEAGVDTFRTAVSDADGLALFEDLPIGRYRFAVVPGSLGDSLPVITEGSGSLRITANPDSLGTGATSLVGYSILSVAEARTAAPGRRVFVRGIVSSGLQYFADSSAFLAGVANIRVTSAAHQPGRSGNNPGDSVSVFGTTGTDAGQPVLVDGLIQTLSEEAAPVATDITVAEVNTARGGELDAALVRVGTAAVGDTATVDGDFHVEITADGATALVVYDSKNTVPKTAFVAGRELEVRGMLVPTGSGTWFLKPRPVNGETVFH
jgi:hypothetical protein